jgi:hypothetical protein
MVDYCLGLFTLDDETSTICLVHKSLEEYVEGEKNALFQKGHSELARVCLTYMTLKDGDYDLRGFECPFESMSLSFVEDTDAQTINLEF